MLKKRERRGKEDNGDGSRRELPEQLRFDDERRGDKSNVETCPLRSLLVLSSTLVHPFRETKNNQRSVEKKR